MAKCAICDRETEYKTSWCCECMGECPETNFDYIVAGWASRRAREFEKDRAKVLLENAEVLRSAQEREIGRLVTRVMDLEREVRLPCAHVGRVKHLETENTQLKEQVRELSAELKDATEAVLRLSEALLAKREEEILKESD